MQALYQMDVAGKGVADALAEFEAFWIGREVEGVDLPAGRDRLLPRHRRRRGARTSAPSTRRIDAALAAGWPLKRIEAVLRAILRAGAYELMYRKDVPPRVVITEYVDVAHGFYGDDEPGLVNAVLDAVARDVPATANSTAKTRPARRLTPGADRVR